MARFKKDFDWDQIQRDQEPEEEIVLVSRSELRRDSQEMLDLVKYLIELTPTQFNKLGIDPELEQEFAKARKLTMTAKKRQTLTIAKKMRKVYPRIEDVAWLKQTLLEFEKPKQKAPQWNAIELARTWQQRLLQGAIQAEQLPSQYPEIELDKLQELLTLVAEADKSSSKAQRQQLISYLEQAFTQIAQRINNS